MSQRVLVVNPGSSSLKLSVVESDDSVHSGIAVDAPRNVDQALRDFQRGSGPIDAVGVRVVHGGDVFRQAVTVTPEVLERLQPLSVLAPLHNPPALAALRAMMNQEAGVPIVACFDTAFHATLPAAARTFAIPERWRRDWSLRRFGFHGLSHAYAAGRAAELLGRAGDGGLRLVTCHLGAGASLAAVAGGMSVDTTMGFTPMDGLVMATRSGGVDPGLVLWLCTHANLSPAAIQEALDRDSGLLALAGTADMRQVLAGAAAGDERCLLGRDVYVHRLCGLMAAMVASMDGVDGIVFTGGVGEHSAEIRQLACARLRHLGVAVDADANRAWDGQDGSIALTGAAVDVMVVVAREDLEIAREVRRAIPSR